MSLHHHPLSAVKTRRTVLDIKASDLAHILAIEPGSYSRIERGERRIYLDKAVRLAATLQCTVEQLAIEPTSEEKIAIYAAKQQSHSGNNVLPKTTEQTTGTVVSIPATETPAAHITVTIKSAEQLEAELIADWSPEDD